jgi:hypothetical protein
VSRFGRAGELAEVGRDSRRPRLAAVEDAGFEPVVVDLERADSKEAFVHPASAGLGFPIQTVQAPSDDRRVGAR